MLDKAVSAKLLFRNPADGYRLRPVKLREIQRLRESTWAPAKPNAERAGKVYCYREDHPPRIIYFDQKLKLIFPCDFFEAAEE